MRFYRLLLASLWLGLVAPGQLHAQTAAVQAAVQAAPSIDIPFTLGYLPPAMSFTRSGSVATYFDATGTLQNATANVPRFDHSPTSPFAPLGILLEQASTNEIRNSTGQGGSSSTIPTNWAGLGTTAGITASVVATGTEEGIPYYDFLFNGTATSGLSFYILFEQPTQIVSANGQTWTESLFMKYVANPGPPSAIYLTPSGRTNTGSYSEGNSVGTNFVSSITSAILSSQRFSTSYTNTLAGTVFQQPFLQVNINNGQVINFTLRIGLPQLEQLPFATSPIPTYGSAVTRNADSLTIPLSVPLAIGAPGTLVSEAMLPVIATAGNGTLTIDDGTATNGYGLRNNNSIGWATSLVYSNNGAANATPNLITNSANVTHKLGISWSGGANQISVGDAGSVSATSFAAPTTKLTTMHIGSQLSGSNILNGWVSRARYWPRQMSASELAGYTRQ